MLHLLVSVMKKKSQIMFLTVVSFSKIHLWLIENTVVKFFRVIYVVIVL